MFRRTVKKDYCCFATAAIFNNKNTIKILLNNISWMLMMAFK